MAYWIGRIIFWLLIAASQLVVLMGGFGLMVLGGASPVQTWGWVAVFFMLEAVLALGVWRDGRSR